MSETTGISEVKAKEALLLFAYITFSGLCLGLVMFIFDRLENVLWFDGLECEPWFGELECELWFGAGWIIGIYVLGLIRIVYKRGVKGTYFHFRDIIRKMGGFRRSFTFPFRHVRETFRPREALHLLKLFWKKIKEDC